MIMELLSFFFRAKSIMKIQAIIARDLIFTPLCKKRGKDAKKGSIVIIGPRLQGFHNFF